MAYKTKNKPTVSQSVQDYKERIKFIRPYTTGFSPSEYDLRYIRTLDDLTRKQKAEINRYYKEIVELRSRSVYIYRPRRKDRLKQVQKYAQHRPRFPRIKVAFVPVTGIEKPVIRFSKKGELSLTYKNVRRQPLYFEDYGITEKDLMTNLDDTLEEFISQLDFNAYRVIAGEHEADIGRTFQNRRTIKEKVIQLMAKYSADVYDPNNPSSQFWGNWMFGVVGYNFVKADDIIASVQIERKKRDERNKINQKIKPLKRKLNEEVLKEIRAIRKAKNISNYIKESVLKDLYKEADQLKLRIAKLEDIKYRIMSS